MTAQDAEAVIEHKFENMFTYSAHVRNVFAVKSMLWSQRATVMDAAVNPTNASDFVMICADSIDQSHWALPRDPALKNVKSIASYKRPTCVIVCVGDWYIV